MEMSGVLRGTFTFQFLPGEWLSRELFVKTLLADFFKSSALGFEVEAEFQSFAGACPNKVFLIEFPQCPIWYNLMYYLENGEFYWPDIALPFGCLSDRENIVSEVSYNGTFLPLIATYACMPSFRRSGIDSFPHAPTFRQKINDLRISTQVIESSHEFWAGCANGEVLKGRRFLAQLPREFRVSLSFTMRDSSFKGFLRRGVSIKLKGGSYNKKPPSGVLGNFLPQ